MRKVFDCRFRLLCVLLVGSSMVIDAAAIAGTIRHDRSDHLYRSGARDPALNAVGQLKVGDEHNCSAVLIAPDWVLTAAHCFISGRGASLAQTLLIQGVRYDIGPNDIFINPEWSFDVLTTVGDIALIRLPRPAKHVRPIRLNTSFQEVGQTGYIAGFGSSGTGLTGNAVREPIKRIGVNMIDATEARVTFASKYPFPAASVGSNRALLTDFDDPQRNASTLGDTAPLNMEYTSAKGDSGGPLLLYRNGSFTVAGIVSGGIDGFDGTSRLSSFYSDVATFTRVASYRRWVESTMSGNSPSIPQMMQRYSPADAAAARRRIAQRDLDYRKHGIRVQSRQTVVEYLPPSLQQLTEPLDRRPLGGLLALVNDATDNVRKMAEHAQREDPPVVYFDCGSCGGDDADGK